MKSNFGCESSIFLVSCVLGLMSSFSWYTSLIKPSLIIAGLGNPGSTYERTRHNVGFRAVDFLSEKFGQGAWKETQKFAALTQEARVVTVPVLLVKPLTFMNLSGESLKKIVDFYKLTAAEQIIILVDDVDLPLGTLRLRKSGGPGTHNGLKSLVEQFGEGFPRIRIGVGPQPENADLATWVLSRMASEEEEVLRRTVEQLPEMVKEFVLGGGSSKTIA